MLRDALRHERMRELQEDRPAPSREERHLAMEPPAHRVRSENGRGLHANAPLAGYGDAGARARRQSAPESA